MAAPRRVGMVTFRSVRRPRGGPPTRARAAAEDLTYASPRTVRRLFEHGRCRWRRHAHLVGLLSMQTRW